MNNKHSNQKTKFTRGNGLKNLVISIVILVEILAIMGVATFAWVETVSSIKLATLENKDLKIDTYVYTDAEIGSSKNTIDIAGYFKQSGDMHLAPASSANGTTFYFPQAASATSTNYYRKGNSSDKNTSYLSVSFRIKTDTNADFFFTEVPSFSALGSDIRVSVTTRSEGSDEAPVTTIYALSAGSFSVVNTTTGDTATAKVEAFSAHTKGKGSSARLFSVGADETKIVTINLWLQKKSTDVSGVMSQPITINNLGIVSSLTPRRVTLMPTSTWEPSGTTTYFYAWCWGATNGDSDRLYKLELDENEHYSFDYSGSYQNTLFLRSGNANLTTENIGDWSDVWKQTVNTAIPASPVDPTYIITNYGSDGTNSTGDWIEPATIKVAYVTDQDENCGTLTATSYIGTTTSTTVLETTNSSKDVHKDTVHAWPGKSIRLTVSPKTNYQFIGWYTNEEGTGNAVSTSTSYTPTAPSTASEVTYYAKFKEVAKITVQTVVDNVISTTAVGKITINGTSYTSAAPSLTVDKGASVTFSATANAGYTLKGIYTTQTGSTVATSPATVNGNVTYYAQFTTNYYDVKANAYYSTNGTTYTAGATGGTVKVGSSAAGATSTASVKYKSNVTLTASPASGYSFVGWYDGTGTSASQLSTSTSYTYTLNTAGTVNVYARFSQAASYYLTGWINGSAVTTTNSALKFTPTGTANEYTLTYKFTGNEGGYQYVTIYDGSTVYHPATHNSNSGAIGSTTDTSPNNDPKWRVGATTGDEVIFTWNSSTKKLTWSKYFYINGSNCSWYYNDSAKPAVSYNYGDYIVATQVSGNIYRIPIPGDVTTFSVGRSTSSGVWNAFDVSYSNTNNYIWVNSNSDGYSWSRY